jgi:two-component system, response regulator PdtaR
MWARAPAFQTSDFLDPFSRGPYGAYTAGRERTDWTDPMTTNEEQSTTTARVVIAEDEAIVRLDLREILEEEGFNVIGETGRGDEALNLIRELEPDLAILDIKMPGLDGLSVARQVAPERKTAVLVLTAFSQRSAIEEARDAGAMAYLIKPFQRSELVPAVHVALARFHEDIALHKDETRGSTRAVFDKAKAILMDDHGLDEQNAIAFLKRESDEELRDIAQQVVDGKLKP